MRKVGIKYAPHGGVPRLGIKQWNNQFTQLYLGGGGDLIENNLKNIFVSKQN